MIEMQRMTTASSAVVMQRPQVHYVDAREFLSIVEDYFAFRRAEGKVRKVTIDSYRWQLQPFIVFWRDHPELHNHQLSSDVLNRAWRWIVDDYRNAQGAKLGLGTATSCLVRLKQVFAWAYLTGCTGHVNLTSWCPKLKRRPSRHYYPSLDELKVMIATPHDENRLRDVAIIAFLLSTGARLFEAENAMVGNLEFNTPITNLQLGADHAGSCHLVQTKGDHDGEGPGRHVVFCAKAGLLLKCYLRTQRRQPHEPVFGLGGSGISQVVRRHAEACGLPNLSPHAFRRAFADHWDDVHGMEGRSLLKRQLGHSEGSDVTQRHYISHNPRRIVRDLMKAHVSPLDRIDLDWNTFPVHIVCEVQGHV